MSAYSHSTNKLEEVPLSHYFVFLSAAILFCFSTAQSAASESACHPIDQVQITIGSALTVDQGSVKIHARKDGSAVFVARTAHVRDRIYTDDTRNFLIWSKDLSDSESTIISKNVFPENSSIMASELAAQQDFLWVLIFKFNAERSFLGSQLIKIKIADGLVQKRINFRGHKMAMTNIHVNTKGKVRLSGAYNKTSPKRLVLRVVSLDDTGELDKTFGTEGVLDTEVGATSLYDSRKTQTVFGGFASNQKDMLLGGAVKFNCPAPHFRCNQHEQFDAIFTSFVSGDGREVSKADYESRRNISINEVNQFEVRAGLIDKRDRIVLFGNNAVYGNNSLFIARLNKNGLADMDFGNKGNVAEVPDADAEIGYVFDLFAQPATDKILAVAHQLSRPSAAPAYNERLTISRYDEFGQLDNTFYKDGVLSVPTHNPLGVAVVNQNCLVSVESGGDDSLPKTLVFKTYSL